FPRAVKTAHLRLVHPTPDDIPSCFRLMGNELSWHGLLSQVKSWYRHGESSRCAHDDFKFCLSVKLTESDQRYEA
ncbi:hypothetical protein EV421DRAFT_1694339, partial [Armillaria borealis]